MNWTNKVVLLSLAVAAYDNPLLQTILAIVSDANNGDASLAVHPSLTNRAYATPLVQSLVTEETGISIAAHMGMFTAAKDMNIAASFVREMTH